MVARKRAKTVDESYPVVETVTELDESFFTDSESERTLVTDRTNITLKKAVDILSTDEESYGKSIKRKELGLGLALAGLAESAVVGLCTMQNTLGVIEEKVQNMVTDGKLDDSQVLFLYKLLTENTKERARFILEISKGMNWDKLRDAVVDLDLQDSTGSRTTVEESIQANELLQNYLNTNKDIQ